MKILQGIRAGKRRCDNGIKIILRRVSIFKRLNFSFLLLILTTAIFLTFFSFYKYSDEISDNIDRYASLLVQNVKMKIQDSLEAYETEALAFYDNSQVIAALQENAVLAREGVDPENDRYARNRYSVENRLYNMRRTQRYIVNIQFVSPTEQYRMVEGSGFTRGGLIKDMEKFYQSDFYLLPQEKKGYPVWIDSQEQTWTFYKNEQSIYGLGNIVTLCVAVYGPIDKDFLGVLIMNIDLKAFSGAMEGYESYRDGNAFLVGRDGVLLSYNPSIQAPAFPKESHLYELMEKEKSGITEEKIDGKKVLIAFERVSGTGMFVTYFADMDVLFAGTHHIRNLCILVLLITVVACFVISYYVTVSISDPVKELVEVMQETGGGKWTARYPNSGNDELTVLGERFNEMTDKTDQLIEQVYRSEIRRQEISISWKNAQLSALLMQINPHFLYNTLDIIRWEAMYEAGGESRVTQMIEKFSQLCRMGMCAGGNTITLKEGIEHAKTYLEVLNFRHTEKIGLEIECEAQENRLYMPQFILQPIMENSVIHGFEDGSHGFSIRIRAFCREGKLLLYVQDNGKGMDEQELELLRESMERTETEEGSIGLANVHQRIRLFYGEEYGLRINSRAEFGTEVEISLPVRYQSENMEGNREE